MAIPGFTVSGSEISKTISKDIPQRMKEYARIQQVFYTRKIA